MFSPMPSRSRDSTDLQAYIQQLEGLFIDVRGRGVQWSPQDAALATVWFHADIELATVARVLVEKTRSWRYNNGDTPVPQSLRWYRSAVEKTAYGVPVDQSSNCPGQLAALTSNDVLDDLVRHGKDLASAHHDPAMGHAIATAVRCLVRWQKQDKTDGLIDRLMPLRQRMLKTALAGVGPQAADTLTTAAERRLPEGLIGPTRAAMLRHEMIAEFGSRFELAFPYWEGWNLGHTDVGAVGPWLDEQTGDDAAARVL
ncbi:MAG: hypothetical protein KC502_21555 [Myxococcales bacterium]|nr:hypothetical protein [Myxococcales bacterium]